MTASCARTRRARPLLGTLVEIRAAGANVEAALERAFRAIERVHRAMSAQESTSDIARLRAGRHAGLDPWTRRVLERAEELRLATDGLFDCGACAFALDGIAKGFAVDQAVAALQAAGVYAGAVNAGGDLRLFGDQMQDVCVRAPDDEGRLLRIGQTRAAAVATSASALLVDPRGSDAHTPVAGATVIAADCMTADALTKPCMLAPERAAQIAAQFGAHVRIFGAP
jgi:thiamine biosynthesis lipoprotein